MIEISHVDIVYGGNPKEALQQIDEGKDRESVRLSTQQLVAVIDANLEIKKGEFLVLMGLSGSGKSTLVRSINGLCRPSRGKIWVDGVDVTTCDLKTLRRLRSEKIAMVFQRFALMPWLTIKQNVTFALELHTRDAHEIERRALDSLNRVGLSEWMEQLPHELSGGMQQRVGLARALATQAEILLMDEPFSALDPLIRARLQGELLALQKDLKKTIVFVSHDLDEALKLGDRVAIMQAGRIVQVDEPERILKSPANDYVREFVSQIARHCPTCAAAREHKSLFGNLEAELASSG